MTELRTHENLTAAGLPPEEGPALRVVPDLPSPLGRDVLPPESELDAEMVVRRVVPETCDVITLVLEPVDRGATGVFAFEPGQYVVLGRELDGAWTERCYTISSPPTRPHLLTVTVKRVVDGAMSSWIHEDCRPGDRLLVRGPLGAFTIANHPAHKYLLLSGGSGVTPTLSTLRTIADLAEPLDVVVVHSARTPADLVARGEVEALAAASEGLRIHWICEDDPDGDWFGHRGRLTDDLLATLVPDVAEREVLTCGPPGYMVAVRGTLARLGVDPARAHEESFVLGSLGAPVVPEPREAPGAPGLTAAPVVESDALAGPLVTFGRSGCAVRCGPGTTVLEAAQEAGIFMPSSCGAGMCGTCKSGLLSGEVDMQHNGGIRPREVAAGKFLPCCSTPLGDIVVDV